MEDSRPLEPTAGEEARGTAIIRGGVLRVFAFGYSAILGIVATAIISRAVGPHGFADYVTAMSLISIAMSLSDVGLLALGLREFASLEGESRVRSLRALITLRLGMSVLGAIGIIAFAVLDNYSDALVFGLALAGVGLCFLSLHASYLVPVQATFQLNVVAGLEALRQTLVMGMMIAAALATENIGVVIAAYLPAGILIALATLPFARRIASVVPSFDLAAMSSLLKHVGTYAVAATISSTYAFVAQVVSNAVLDKDDSGLFALAFRVFAVLVGAGLTAIGGAFPLLVEAAAQDDKRRFDYAVRRLMQTSLLTGLACTVGLVTGASAVIAVLGGSEFSGAQGVVALIGVALPASFIVATGAAALLAARRHAHLMVITTLGAGLSILATAVLAAELGIYGAAGGIVIGETALALGYVYAIAKVDRVGLPRIGWAAAVILVAALCCLPALLPISSFLAAVLGLGAFTTITLSLGLVPPELIENARGALGRFSRRSAS